jgi:hypothetical protein
VEIIEALRRIDLPLTVADLVHVSTASAPGCGSNTTCGASEGSMP